MRLFSGARLYNMYMPGHGESGFSTREVLARVGVSLDLNYR